MLFKALINIFINHGILKHLDLTRAKGIEIVNNLTKPLNILDQTSQIWFAYDDAENPESKIKR